MSKHRPQKEIRAAIYARVSSERQAREDRVSIEAQLHDCAEYCAAQGYTVVAEYVDKDKYRARGKLVEPSGQRKDRPAYVRLLEAGHREEYDVVVAWKEDRLHRGIRAAVPLSDLLDEKGSRISVELVRETFDRKLMGIKAALAKIESDNIRERTIMGRREHLKRGEVPGGDQVKYGYRKVNKRLAIDPIEAEVVRKLFEWYVAGEPLMTMRRRLNDGSVPPRKGKLWSKPTIGKILVGEFYATGVMQTTLEDEVFELPCPPIITMELWTRAQAVRLSNKKRPRNVKRDYLCTGLVYCTCGWKCSVATNRARANKGSASLTGTYTCPRYHNQPEQRPDDCAAATGSAKVDQYVWRFVKTVCTHPVLLKSALKSRLT